MSSHSDSEIKSSQTLRLKKSVLFKPTRSKYNHLKNYPVNTFLPTLQEQRLLTAVSTNNTETVKNLLESGVSPNTTDGLRSALHLAASKGYAEIVELLLKYGADPNKQDIVQNTALHLAACTSNLQIITLLINGGADITSLDIHGRNPVQLAKSKLDILRKSWKEGAIEMIQLRSQLQEIVDIMISLFKNRQSTTRRNHRDNIDDLELIKLSIKSGPEEQVDDQMSKLQSELQQFQIK